MVSDGVLFIQKLLKLFPFDAFCIAHEYNKLAAILRGEFSKTVLPHTKIDRGLLDGKQPFFTERHERDGLFDGCIGVRKGIGSELRSAAKLETVGDMLMLV